MFTDVNIFKMVFLDFRKQKSVIYAVIFIHSFRKCSMVFKANESLFGGVFFSSLLLMKFSHFTLSTPASSSLLNLLTFNVQSIGGADVFSLNHQHHFGLLHPVTKSFHKISIIFKNYCNNMCTCPYFRSVYGHRSI